MARERLLVGTGTSRDRARGAGPGHGRASAVENATAEPRCPRRVHQDAEEFPLDDRSTGMARTGTVRATAVDTGRSRNAQDADQPPIPDLARRDFTATVPGTKMVGDITYAMDDNYKTPLITTAIRRAAHNEHLAPGAM